MAMLGHHRGFAIVDLALASYSAKVLLFNLDVEL